MTISKPSLLALAKQGNPKAIAALLNQQLQTKNIISKVSLKNNCLHLMLESEQAPSQEPWVKFICERLTELGVLNLERIKIYGKQIGEDFPAWNREFELGVEALKYSSLNQSFHILDQSKIEIIDSLFSQGLKKNKGQNQEAINLFSQIISLDPSHTEAYFMRASNKLALEHHREAIEDYNRVISLKPDHGQAYYERGLAFFAIEEYQKAVEDYTWSFNYGISYASAYNNRGAAYENLGNYRQAVQDFSKAILIEPNSELYYKNRSISYQKLGDQESAQEDLLKSKELSRGNSSNVSKELAHAGTAFIFSFPILINLLTGSGALIALLLFLLLIPGLGWILIGVITLALYLFTKQTVS
ncbi:tetratricopeptide repeat protein [Leptolyngbya sp. FACHB-541]|uniref:tetratricopeptide repeat protein n=1 Tax=Leptolyngbya sp. FACHB-541 TaxID=2692810 RepID=UPI0016843267|nr:tetratricopeptide repeat protein [Leptolyngbya sp. FACHB-541]MBD1999400.1 tetratricopeptide repeat protein [Leptolyngbya sp. FACHB-541]